MRPTRFPANFSLSQLNGFNGFTIYGAMSNDLLGSHLAYGGDLNNDGYADFLLGAPSASRFGRVQNGIAYGIFGRKDWSSFNLSSMNATDGFWAVGENSYDLLGKPLNTMGDINGDGKSDMLFAAYLSSPGNRTNAGTVYGILSTPNVTGGFLNMSLLNGVNGFKITGEVAGDNFGGALASGRGINGDNRPAVVIGAHPSMNGAGCNYVYFGNALIGSNGTIPVPNGSSGFKINGSANDHSSFRVLLYDINRDGFNDISTVSYTASPFGRVSAGQTNVIFGSSTLGNNGSFSLTNYSQSVSYSGEVANDGSGWGLGIISDFNRDGYPEIVIGSRLSSAGSNRTNVGRVHVVYGKRNLTSIDLASLNYTQGFKIDGISAEDYAGHWVDGAADIDGDGFDDLIIGAPQLSTGRSGYAAVLLNRIGVGSTGKMNLSEIDGSNGVIFYGISNNAQAGIRAAGIGDVNGDGIKDLAIGAPTEGLSNQGAVHIVFGDRSPDIWTNKLTAHQGEVVQLGPQFLNVTDNAPVNIQLSEIFGGRFELTTAPGVPIANFSYSQLSNVVFKQDNTTTAPAYKVFVPNTGIALPWPPENANITFFKRPTLIRNVGFSLLEGGTIPFTTQLFDVADDYDSSMLIYNVSNSQNIQFQVLGTNVTAFTRQQVLAGTVQIQHDASELTPRYNITPSDPYFNIGPFASNITLLPVNDPPTWQNLRLVINPNSTVVNLTESDFLAMDPDTAPADLSISTYFTTNGYFRSISRAQATSTFSMLNVTNGDIQFYPDFLAAPSLQAAVSDGSFFVGPQQVEVSYNGNALTPKLNNKNLILKQGETRFLSVLDLSATPSVATSSSQIIFTLIDPLHVRFTSYLGAPVTSFSLADIQNGLIIVTHDNSIYAPSCKVSVNDGASTLAAVPMDVIFTPVNQRPVIVNNRYVFAQGQLTAINSTNLNATDVDTPWDSLNFLVTSQGGNFQIFGQTVYNFNQSMIRDGLVWFLSNDVKSTPTVTVSVDDGLLATVPQVGNIEYSVKKSPVINACGLTLFEGEEKAITASDFNVTDSDTAQQDLTLTVSGVKNGDFYLNSQPVVASFPAEAIATGSVTFKADGSKNKPEFFCSASDGSSETPLYPAAISFTTVNHAPYISYNTLFISENQEEVLTVDDLKITDDGPPPLLAKVAKTLNCHFAFVGNSKTALDTFTYDQVIARNILLVPHGSSTPEYVLQAQDAAGLVSNQSNATVIFTPSPHSGWFDAATQRTFISVGLSLLVSGATAAIVRKLASDTRRTNSLAKNLRKVLQLQYWDFARNEGAVYLQYMASFGDYLNQYHNQFYTQRCQEDNCERFAVILGKVLKNKKLVEESKVFSGLFSMVCCFSKGWSNRLDLNQFHIRKAEIAEAAVKAWGMKDTSYSSFKFEPRTNMDKVKGCLSFLFCCPRKKAKDENGELELVTVQDGDQKGSPPLPLSRLTLTSSSSSNSSSPSLPDIPENGEVNYGLS